MSAGAEEAVLIDALRTPYGRRGGALAAWHPVDLAAVLISELVGRNRLDGGEVDGVLLGCVSQVGAQACNIARNAVLAAGWSDQVAAVTVDCQAISSFQAVYWAAQAAMAGNQGLLVAGGVEMASQVPLGANQAVPSVGKPYGPRLRARSFGEGRFAPPGIAIEELARTCGFSRVQLDSWAVRSHERASRGQIASSRGVLAVAVDPAVHAPSQKGGRGIRATAVVESDEAVDAALTTERMAAFAPIFVEGGVITAANIAAEGDGAAAVIVCGARRAKSLGLIPAARFVSVALAGCDPRLWPAASIPATKRALQAARLHPGDIDSFEVHESSAAAVLAWLEGVGADPDRVNPNGGALAHTAPAGAAGAGLFVNALACTRGAGR
ncbi:MAG TPA: thiolase family protein, partial [Acidimicrobiales bacterium]|nr:thiolase family protein [Acidimicrobiales bacterium]